MVNTKILGRWKSFMITSKSSATMQFLMSRRSYKYGLTQQKQNQNQNSNEINRNSKEKQERINTVNKII